MAGKGGKQPGAGRKAGIPNKATAEIKALAQVYGPAAIKKLAELAGLVEGASAAESEAARAGALQQILDRGYGKPSQAVEIGAGEGLEALLDRIASGGR